MHQQSIASHMVNMLSIDFEVEHHFWWASVGMDFCEGRRLASDGAELFADFQLTGNDEILASLAPDWMRIRNTQRFFKTGDVQVDDIGSRMSHRAGHNISASAVVWFDDWTRINPNNPSRTIQPHFVQFHVDRTTDDGTGRFKP
jgi:hypothetical protein